MLSKSQIRFITSLQHKKFRREHGFFLVEGVKSVTEFIHSNYTVEQIFHTAQAAAKLGKIPQNIKSIAINAQELTRISTLMTPQGVLALVRIPNYPTLSHDVLKNQFTLVLDDIQDPGNLGTIVRTAEWFGFKRVICSMDTVDAYNPKVVQASMGSLSRIEVIYTDIEKLTAHTGIPVFGAVLDGQSIFETEFGSEGLILLGNEGNGIRMSLMGNIQHPITIPRIGGAESLNVAVSAALCCAEVVRSTRLPSH